MPHQRQRVRYFDASGRECSPTEATSPTGILKSGYALRVPTTLRDSRFSDARSFWDANRDSFLCVDSRRVGGTEGNKPGYRVLDHDFGRAEREAAYAEAEAYRRDAWRQPVRDAFGSIPYTAATVGSACTINGAPGRLVKEGGVLVCRPIGTDARTLDTRDCPDCNGTGETGNGDDCERCDGTGELDDDDNGKETSDRRTVDQIAHDHSVAMQRIYDARNREISEAWREGKGNK